MTEWAVILVGCGNMGRAMLTRWLNAGAIAPHEVAVVDPNASQVDQKFRTVYYVKEPEDLPIDSRAKIVVFAVKPQLMPDVVPKYRHFGTDGALFLSVAAGVPFARLEQYLGGPFPIVRCMPNISAVIGYGISAIIPNALVDDETLAPVLQLLATNGHVEVIANEDLMHAVTAISGSGPAFFLRFMECMEEAAVSIGLPKSLARKLVLETARGSTELLSNFDATAKTLRCQVASPHGTTAAGLAVLDRTYELPAIVRMAVQAAHDRSVELTKDPRSSD